MRSPRLGGLRAGAVAVEPVCSRACAVETIVRQRMVMEESDKSIAGPLSLVFEHPDLEGVSAASHPAEPRAAETNAKPADQPNQYV